jgi:hypothetical protein
MGTAKRRVPKLITRTKVEKVPDNKVPNNKVPNHAIQVPSQATRETAGITDRPDPFIHCILRFATSATNRSAQNFRWLLFYTFKVSFLL